MNLSAYKKKYIDDRFYKEVFVEGIYNPVKRARIKDIVIDVGAGAGEFSFWIHRYARKIYAIEPEEKTFRELKSNIKEFGFDKVKPFKLALSNENGTGSLAIGVPGGSRLDFGPDSPDETTPYQVVETKTLATFMKENKINHVDILKIDIETNEHEVFTAPDFKDIADKIDLIIGEHSSVFGDTLNGLGFKTNHYYTR